MMAISIGRNISSEHKEYTVFLLAMLV